LIVVFNPAKAEVVLPVEIAAKKYVDLQTLNPEEALAMIVGVPELAEFKATEFKVMEMESSRIKESGS
jgi:hypothetical protein